MEAMHTVALEIRLLAEKVSMVCVWLGYVNVKIFSSCLMEACLFCLDV